jgi:hypothetical protein
VQGEYVVAIIAVVIFVTIYITPPIIAFKRGHPQRWSITVLSLFFGGTLIGWVAALVWAIQPLEGSDNPTQAEEAEILALSTPSVSEEIERLHQLLQTGAITQTEFDNLKMKLLGSA